MINNTNFQTFHQMGSAINDVVRQATGRDNVRNIDMDYVTVAQNKRKVEKVVTGDVASFVADQTAVLDYIIAKINPVQSGSGDPSPENIRPISGWTEANVNRTGINVWDEEWESGSISPATGANTNDNTRIRSKNYISVLPSTAYYYKSSKDLALRYYGIDKTFIGTGSAKNNTVTTPANCYFMRFAEIDTTEYANDISINYPATDTQYHAYTGATYSITFPSSAGTVYGATLTINRDGTGELVVTHDIQTITNVSSWTDKISTQNRVYSPYTRMAMYNGLDDPYTTCNITVKSTTGAQLPSDAPFTITIGAGASNNYVYINGIKSIASDITAFNAFLAENPLIFTYKLATPQTIHLTVPQVQLLLGLNNIWADTGNVTVMYSCFEEVI